MSFEKAVLQKWKHAVVHLEGATSSRSAVDISEEVADHLREGRHEEAADLVRSAMLDVRSWGTAIYLRHEDRRFLITARHVLFDEHGARHLLEREQKRLEQDDEAPEQYRSAVMESAVQSAERTVYPHVFRVPLLDEVRSGMTANTRMRDLMNLGTGAPMNPCTLSSQDVDLAIISLDNRRSEKPFADCLDANGYMPISLDDIADQPSVEGARVFTVGFPGSTAMLGELELDQWERAWASNYLSLPVFAFGRVAMLHPAVEQVWCDLSVSPGNSGGPVVEDGKLVGIVVKQALESGRVLEDDDTKEEAGYVAEVLLPFTLAVKARHIRDLVTQQISKDERRKQIFNRPS